MVLLSGVLNLGIGLLIAALLSPHAMSKYAATPETINSNIEGKPENACQVYSWGYGFFGQCGVGDNKTQQRPVQVGLGSGIVQIACGDAHCIAVDKGIFYILYYLFTILK